MSSLRHEMERRQSMDSRNSHSLLDTLLLGSFLKAPIDLPLPRKLIKGFLVPFMWKY